jgi:amidase
MPSLRVGFATAIAPVGAVDPICEQSVLETVGLLEEMGHQIEPVTLDFTDLIEPFTTVWQAAVDVGIPWLFLGKLNRLLLRRSRSRSSGVYLRAVRQLQTVARQVVTNLDKLDVLVLPILMHPTIRVGEWAKLRPVKEFEKIVNWITPCPPFNATGQPAIAIPAGFTPDGLPLDISGNCQVFYLTSFQALNAGRKLKPVLTRNKVYMPLLLIKGRKIRDKITIYPLVI